MLQEALAEGGTASLQLLEHLLYLHGPEREGPMAGWEEAPAHGHFFYHYEYYLLYWTSTVPTTPVLTD